MTELLHSDNKQMVVKADLVSRFMWNRFSQKHSFTSRINYSISKCSLTFIKYKLLYHQYVPSINLHDLINKNSYPQIRYDRLQRTSVSSAGLQIRPSGAKQFSSVRLILRHVKSSTCNAWAANISVCQRWWKNTSNVYNTFLLHYSDAQHPHI